MKKIIKEKEKVGLEKNGWLILTNQKNRDEMDGFFPTNWKEEQI